MNALDPAQLQIVVLRPGATDLDEQGRITGSLDIPLSPDGAQQGLRSSAELAAITIDRIYSAPGIAARETAKLIGETKNAKVRIEENLKNLNHGLWHGKRVDELKENQPKLFKQWQENPELVYPPGGETIEDARARAQRVIKRIKRKHKAGNIMLVAAEPLASILLCELDGSDLESRWKISGNHAEWTWVRGNALTV